MNPQWLCSTNIRLINRTIQMCECVFCQTTSQKLFGPSTDTLIFLSNETFFKINLGEVTEAIQKNSDICVFFVVVWRGNGSNILLEGENILIKPFYGVSLKLKYKLCLNFQLKQVCGFQTKKKFFET